MKQKAVVILSGGLDSTTVLAYAISKGFEVIAITFQYNQRHLIEVQKSIKIASLYKLLKHKVITIDPSVFLNSSLVKDNKIEVPKSDSDTKLDNSYIPNTYVPARNTIFLSYALAFAESYNAYDIFIGANQLDYSGYPDCRLEYLQMFEKMSNFAIKGAIDKGYRVKLHAPLINMSKVDIVRLGLSLGVDYSNTHSCYDPNVQGHSCGKCTSCIYRQNAFKELGKTDPIKYVDDI